MSIRLEQLIPEGKDVIRLMPVKKDWNEVLVSKNEITDGHFFESTPLREMTVEEEVKAFRMSEVEKIPVEWLWQPYNPFGKLTIMQGDPGQGKTYIAMQICAACTNGVELPNCRKMEPFNVIYQTAEDGLGDTAMPRLEEAGADLDRIWVIDGEEKELTLTDDRLEKAIIQKKVRLVIIDPLQAYLGSNVDMNRANEVRSIFKKLGFMAQRTGCAVLLIGHVNKAAGLSASYRGLGSVDFRAAVRSLIVVGPQPDSEDKTVRAMAHDKCSLGPLGPSQGFILGDEEGFRWVGPCEVTADEILSGVKQKWENKTEAAMQIIYNMLGGGKEVYNKDLEAAVVAKGIRPRTFREAKKLIGNRLLCRTTENHQKVYWLDQS